MGRSWMMTHGGFWPDGWYRLLLEEVVWTAKAVLLLGGNGTSVAVNVEDHRTLSRKLRKLTALLSL